MEYFFVRSSKYYYKIRLTTFETTHNMSKTSTALRPVKQRSGVSPLTRLPLRYTVLRFPKINRTVIAH